MTSGKAGSGFSRREVRLAGQPVQYQVAGEGDAVILVHGLSGSTRWWTRNTAALTAHYQTYLVDLPGFGATRGRHHRFVLAEAARWLEAWMEAVGLGRAHLVGHSMGGYICIRLAAHRPEFVDRLVLIAPTGVPTGRSYVGYLGPLLAAARHAAPGFLPILARDALRAGPRTVLLTARDLLNEDVRSYLPLITAPTLLIFGEHDPLVPPAVGISLREHIAGARLLVLNGAGHVPMFDRAREFNTALLAFLAEEPLGE